MANVIMKDHLLFWWLSQVINLYIFHFMSRCEYIPTFSSTNCFLFPVPPIPSIQQQFYFFLFLKTYVIFDYVCACAEVGMHGSVSTCGGHSILWSWRYKPLEATLGIPSGSFNHYTIFSVSTNHFNVCISQFCGPQKGKKRELPNTFQYLVSVKVIELNLGFLNWELIHSYYQASTIKKKAGTLACQQCYQVQWQQYQQMWLITDTGYVVRSWLIDGVDVCKCYLNDSRSGWFISWTYMCAAHTPCICFLEQTLHQTDRPAEQLASVERAEQLSELPCSWRLTHPWVALKKKR